MKTRDEAVAYLIGRGMYAAKRDWALGETVVVAAEASKVDGITAFKRAMYLAPKEHGWFSFELDAPRDDDENIVSLQQACDRGLRILSTAR